MPDIDYAARVKRGAEFLDEKRPGWEREIEAKRLNLRLTCDCILGQLYESYYAGSKILDIGSESKAVTLGFNVEGNPSWPQLNELYRGLDRLWIAEIRARLHPAPPPAVELPAWAGALELQPV